MVRLLQKKYLYKRQWLTARCDSIQLDNGAVIPEYYVLEYPVFVNIIAITKDGQMVIIRQYRHAIGQTNYELVAGTMDVKDASPLQAAQRELLEETGYGNGVWSEFMKSAPNPSSMNNWNYTYLARDVEKISDQKLDATEDISVSLFTEEQVLHMIRNGEIIQALMLAPLWKYFSKNKFE